MSVLPVQSLAPPVALAWRIDEARASNDAGPIAATAMRNGLQYAVRLDSIRASTEPAPLIELDDNAPLLTEPLSPEQAAAEARLDAQSPGACGDAASRTVKRAIERFVLFAHA